MTAALLLSRFEVPVVILEASEQRDPLGSKALCMQSDVLDVLERIGCGSVLAAEGVTWTLGRTYYREHELFQITFPEIGERAFPPFVNIGQDRTEHHLARAVAAQPLIDLRHGHRVMDILNREHEVEVVANTADGEARAIGAYAIGADGAGSTTRKILDLPFGGRTFDDRFLICDIRADLPFANERRFFFDPEWNPDRQVLIHPQPDSVWRIDWQVPPDFDVDVERDTGRLDRRIRKIVGDRDYEIVWMSVYRFHQRMAARFRVGRTFIAGDAAHLVAPFGARGLNSGIQDAENLAWKLAYVLRGWADAELLDTYDEERAAAARENLAITGKTMEFLVPQTPEQWDVRRATLEAAIDHPDARQMVDSGRLAEPFVYTDSSLTTPGEIGAAVVPGSRFPDGAVAVPGRPEVRRMRELFGEHLLVLASENVTGIVAGLRPVAAPIEVYELDAVDTHGTLAGALGAAGPAAVVIRPDGHVAAVVRPDGADVAAAVATTLASPLG